MNKKWPWFGLALLVLVGSIWSFGYYQRHREATLLERANLYWKAIQSRDVLTAYHLEAETVSGHLQPDEVELSRSWGIRLIRFSFGQIVYFDNKAEISVIREMTLPDTELGKTKTKQPIRDRWTFYNGQWYHGTPENGGSGIRRR
jgi:hypothetical protein